MRQNVAERRLQILSALESRQLTADALNTRLWARRTELEENLYDGILAQPVPTAATSVPIYGSKPISDVLDAARLTVYNNVLYFFKQLLEEKYELLSQY